MSGLIDPPTSQGTIFADAGSQSAGSGGDDAGARAVALGDLSDDDRERLVTFYHVLEGVLGWIIRQPDLLPGALGASYARAWTAVLPRFGQVRSVIASGAIDARLIECGLYGDQLDLKLDGCYLALENMGVGNPLNPIRRGFDKGKELLETGIDNALDVAGKVRPFVGNLLDWMDVVAGSVAIGFPPAEAITEVKDGVKVGLKTVRIVKEQRGSEGGADASGNA